MTEFKLGSQIFREYIETAQTEASNNLEYAFGPTALKTISEIVPLVVSAVKAKEALIFFGNGGSAAEATHIAAEFTGKCLIDHEPWFALSLNDSISAITSISNDYSFEQIFARQILPLANAARIAFGLTTSGNSQTVINCLIQAKELGLTTVLMCGDLKNIKIKDYLRCVDFILDVPSSTTPRIQEIHLLWGHLISEITEVQISRNF